MQIKPVLILGVRAKLLLLAIALFIIALAGCSKKNPYETQEPTPYLVSTVESGLVKISHYMLPGHSEVEPVIALVKSFVGIDLTQSWDKLDWEPLRPLVASQFDLNRRIYAESYRAAGIATRVESLDIKQITYYTAVGLAGSPLNSATARVDVVTRYLRAEPDWLERHGVTLDSDYAVFLELRLTKAYDGWRVSSANYARHPSHGPLR